MVKLKLEKSGVPNKEDKLWKYIYKKHGTGSKKLQRKYGLG